MVNNVLVGSYYGEYFTQAYTYDTTTDIATLSSDTCVTTNNYNYALIILDDYTLNRLNDGLVTITSSDMDIPLPSYGNRHLVCNPLTGTSGYGNGRDNNNNQLTANRLYAANQLLNNQRNNSSSASSTGLFAQDVFALVPIKQGNPGQTFTEYGGTLQNQDRLYFGPVNIRRMSVQLMSDKGILMDLNGVDWTFAVLVEQLYKK